MALTDASWPLPVPENISSESILRHKTSTQPETELAIHMSKSEGPKETETSTEEPDGVSRDVLEGVSIDASKGPEESWYIPGHVPTHIPEYAPAYYVLAGAPLFESGDVSDDPPWFEPKYTSTDVSTDGPSDLPQTVPEDFSQSIPECCPPAVSQCKREVLSNLSNEDKILESQWVMGLHCWCHGV